MSAPSQLWDGSLILASLSPLPSLSNQSPTHTRRSHPSHPIPFTHTPTPECSPFLALGLSRLSGVMSLLIHVWLSSGPRAARAMWWGRKWREFRELQGGEGGGGAVISARHKVIS